MKKVWGLALVVALFSCEDNSVQVLDGEKAGSEIEGESADEKQKQISFEDEVAFAKFCSNQLEEGNIEVLRPYTNGSILLSPYAYIDQSNVRKVSLNEIAAHTEDIHYWGVYDGRGDSILMTTPEYLNKYVLTFDINDKKVKTNTYNSKPKAYGSELHNMHEIYPNATFVEFYHPPSEEGYMDWNALIFVVEKIDNQYQLKAIIHNQWTV